MPLVSLSIVADGPIFSLTSTLRPTLAVRPGTNGQFKYTGEGWGLTHNATQLIMSDGSASLRFLDPKTLTETHRVLVTDAGIVVRDLNELEWVNGEIYANIWQTNFVARISPSTGRVLGWIDLSGLLSQEEQRGGADVLNGIAYDAAGRRLFVTGKLWPKVFEIGLVAR